MEHTLALIKPDSEVAEIATAAVCNAAVDRGIMMAKHILILLEALAEQGVVVRLIFNNGSGQKWALSTTGESRIDENGRLSLEHTFGVNAKNMYALLEKIEF